MALAGTRLMITQRLIHKPDGSVTLIINAEPASVAEVVELARELDMRSTVTTEGPIHYMTHPHPRSE